MIGTLWAVVCRLLLIAACVVVVASLGGLFMLYPHVGLIIAAAAIWQTCRRGFGSGWVHGVARTAEWDDLYQANMIGGNTGTIIGTTAFIAPPSKRYAVVKLFTAPLRRSVLAVRIFLGTFWGMSWCNNMLIRVPDACHLATFAKTGGGKGVSIVIPTLLSDPRSAVVSDPKRENAKITGRHRARHFGHRVVVLDPFGNSSDSFNPLDTIPANSPDLIDRCKDLAAALVVKTGKETEPHFVESAERILQAMIAFVCVSSPSRDVRNLQSVRELVSSREKFEEAKRLMSMAGGLAGGMLQRLGNSLSWHVDRELASTLATVQRFTSFLDSPQVAANTRTSTFDPVELLKGKMTIFLCLPASRLKTYAPLQRMWLTSIMGSITHNTDERKQTLFLLDEVGNMGHLQCLQDAVTMYRGMGMRLHFIFQSLGQVKELFGDGANTFLDNIGTQLFFNVQSFETADSVSKRCGDSTVTTESEQFGDSSSQPTGGSGPGSQAGSRGNSRSRTISELCRKLLKPEEILTMNPLACVCFHNHHAPILARLVRYYNSPLFCSPITGGLRTGRPGGLDVKGGVMAAATLVMSFAIAYGAAALPQMPVPRIVKQMPSQFNQLKGNAFGQFGQNFSRGNSQPRASTYQVSPMRYTPSR